MKRTSRKMSDQHKAKISQSCKGKKRTEEQKQNISRAKQGIKRNEETKRKISDSLKAYWETIPTEIKD